MKLSPNFKKMMGMAEGLKELPTSAAGHKQKPVDDFGYKPTDAETQRDIELDKAIAPIQREEFMKARARMQEDESPKPEPDYTTMSWEDLYNLRKGKSPEEQTKIAPYEHRAFAREYIKENPEAAIVMPGMIMAYNIAKGLGLHGGRSEAGAKAIAEGMKGWLEGIGGATREGVGKLLENYEDLKKDLTWTPLPSGEQVWEEGEKNGTKIKQELKEK